MKSGIEIIGPTKKIARVEACRDCQRHHKQQIEQCGTARQRGNPVEFLNVDQAFANCQPRQIESFVDAKLLH